MAISVGDKLPDAQFGFIGPDGPARISTSELTGGKKVVLFALPGAFTPTCSAKHVPGYLQNVQALRDKGVDTIACLSVNDAFVMGAWARDQGTGDDVMMLADGNGSFAQAVGLDMDGSAFGMGLRSQRYAMVVDDGVVTGLFVEAPGEFKVSAAEHVLASL